MIVGDANLSEVATFLKVGTTAIVLAMIEDDVLPRDLALRRARCRRCARCPTTSPCQGRSSWPTAPPSPPSRCSGSCSTGPASTPTTDGLEPSCGEEVGAEVLRRWEAVLTGLETDPMALADQLDWVAKYRLLDGYRERHGLEWDDARLAAMDLQYHDLRPEKSLFARLGLERLVTDDEVEAGRHRAAADDTRAYFRGEVPAPLRRRHRGRQLGLAWCSTSAATRCGGCR